MSSSLDRFQSATDNFNKYMAHHLPNVFDLTQKPAATLEITEVEVPKKQADSWYVPNFLRGESKEKRARILLSADKFPANPHLLDSGFFDAGLSERVEPFMFINRYYRIPKAEPAIINKVGQCKMALADAETKLQAAKNRKPFYPQLVQNAQLYVETCKQSLAAAIKQLDKSIAEFIKLDLKDLRHTHLFPAIFEATGLLPRFEYNQSGFPIALSSIECLVPFDDPMRVKQVSLNKKIIDLYKYAANMAAENEEQGISRDKSVELWNLACKLENMTKQFFLDYNRQSLRSKPSALKARYETFKKDFQEAVSQTDNLDLRRGYIRPLVHTALTFAAGLGLVTAAVDYGSEFITGAGISGKTTSRTRVDAIKDQFEKCVDDALPTPKQATSAA